MTISAYMFEIITGVATAMAVVFVIVAIAVCIRTIINEL